LSSSTQIKAGWVAGLGIEAKLNSHWSARAEWLHHALGSLSDTLTTVGSAGTQSAVWSRSERFDVIRTGVNYHFA
jgi:outer membrane immunogenic protein